VTISARTRSGLVGCLAGALVLAVAVAAVIFWIVNETAAERQRAMLAAMPPGWTALFAQRATLPASVIALEPDRTEPGDAAVAVNDTASGVWTIFRVDSTFDRVTGGAPAPDDSFTLSELAADTALDHWRAYAARTEWRGLDRVLAHQDSAGAHDLLRMVVPDYGFIRAASTALALRGWTRAEHGDLAAAARDMRGALGLGAMLVRSEPTLTGFLTGREAVHDGAVALQHLADLTHDPALADQAADAAAWSAPSTASDYDILAAAPDSALRLAGDTAIGLGWRAEALAAAIRGPMARPAGRLFGVPGRLEHTLDSLAATRHGDFGRLATIAAATAHGIDALGPRGRMRRFGD